ncbi:hypothetical protein [Nocardia brasiliensis]
MKNVGLVARVAGVGVAMAAAVVLTAGTASAKAVELTIQKNDGSLVQVNADVGLGVSLLSPCNGLIGLDTDAAVSAGLLNLVGVDVDGKIVACA